MHRRYVPVEACTLMQEVKEDHQKDDDQADDHLYPIRVMQHVRRTRIVPAVVVTFTHCPTSFLKKPLMHRSAKR